MPLSWDQIKAPDVRRWPVPLNPIVSEPVPVPSSVTANGNTGFIRVQWASIPDVTGYRVAVMTDRELDTPNVGIATLYGSKYTFFDFLTGNVAQAMNFAVQGFRDNAFGNFSAIVSATSQLMTAAGAAPPAPPAPPATTQTPPPSGAGPTGTGHQTNTF